MEVPKLPPEFLEQVDQMQKENAAREKQCRRKQWWRDNWIGFAGLVVAVIALAVSIVALLK